MSVSVVVGLENWSVVFLKTGGIPVLVAAVSVGQVFGSWSLDLVSWMVSEDLYAERQRSASDKRLRRSAKLLPTTEERRMSMAL